MTLKPPVRFCKCVACALVLLGSCSILCRPLAAANTSQTDTAPRRIRLIMKDGSYQVVLSYRIVGNIVRYRSAERNGESEDIPVALVDLPATEKWVRDHSPNAVPDAQHEPVLSPELAKEEADRAARTPEIAPGLLLPEEDSVLVLDTFNGTPELVPLEQVGGDLNKETAHNVLKLAINPAASAHDILDIRGDRADVQVHVAMPVFYVRIGPDDEGDTGGSAITVDTHGAAGRAAPSGGADNSGYVVERLDMRSDTRQVDSFRIALLGEKPQPDVIEMNSGILPGGHWMKLTPAKPMEFGEYALVEVLSDHEVNLGVWDFGVHPGAKEDVEAIHPVSKRPITLEHRSQQ
jgi:hypothetical protein